MAGECLLSRSRDRLADEVRARIEDALLDDGVVGVAGHEQRANARTELGQMIHQDPAAHPRHDDVRQDEMDLGRVPFGHQQCGRPVLCQQDGESGADEDSLGDLSHRLVVFHREDDLRAEGW